MVYYLTEDLKELYTKKGGWVPLYKASKSSVIKGVGYKGGVLYIAFNTNVVYGYKKVPTTVVLELLRIIKKGEKESLGQYFDVMVRKAPYRYMRAGIINKST